MTTEVSLNQNFDELFIKAEKEPQAAFIHLSLTGTGSYSGPVTRVNSQANSRVNSNANSRNSPARKPTLGTGMCPSNPAILGLRKQASRSHSMRDQTAHMREKFLSERLTQRRQSITRSPMRTPNKCESRNNSLQGEDIEVTRQFLATHSKVINRGDSFKRKNHSFGQKKKNAVGKQDMRRPPENTDDPSLKTYRVAFLGASSVGKTSIIDQFMSSEHTDVYERNDQEDQGDIDIEIRTVSVDVNGEESKLDLIEPTCDNIRVSDVVEDQNPDCLVVVYSVDDLQSFGQAEEYLDWLTKNNYISTKPCILVGNKADLVRSRVLETNTGCDLAIKYGVKFTETSPGCGHHIDELLVGIAMQLRLNESRERKGRGHGKSIKETVKGILSLVTGKEEEKRRHCRNLNIL